MPYTSELANVYDLVYSTDRPKDYMAEAEDIARIVRSHVPDADSVLDVGCGTGQHLQHFGRLFKRTHGLDLSAPMLDVAATRVPRDTLHIGDMRNFQLHERFSAITCLFSAIGYVRSSDELNQTMRNFASHLTPGGVLVVEPWFLPEQFEAGRVHVNTGTRDGVSLVRMSYWERAGNISHVTMHYLVGSEGAGIQQWTEVHVMSLFGRHQYEDALAAAGFKNIRWQPSWREDRERIVCVGQSQQ